MKYYFYSASNVEESDCVFIDICALIYSHGIFTGSLIKKSDERLFMTLPFQNSGTKICCQ